MKPTVGSTVFVENGLHFARAIVEETYFAGVKVRLIEDCNDFKSGTSLIVSYEKIAISKKAKE